MTGSLLEISPTVSVCVGFICALLDSRGGHDINKDSSLISALLFDSLAFVIIISMTQALLIGALSELHIWFVSLLQEK